MCAEERPAFYALPPGGWRDVWTLLHPPYTVWHLSYVVIGAALAPRLHIGWMLETMAAFFLAMGIAAHALDELHGRPLGTAFGDATLKSLAAIGLMGAVAIGVHGAFVSTPWMWALIPVGGFLVLAYNLELVGGRFHSDGWFAVAWGGFPLATSYVAQTGTIRPAAVIGAGACIAFSAAQRVLSTPVRKMRRRVERVEGRVMLRDGSIEELDAATLRSTPERALRLMSVAVPSFAIALVVARLS